MDSDHDPILDACLEEVLANRQPPNLAPRIVRALGESTSPVLPTLQPLPLDQASSPTAAIISVAHRQDLRSTRVLRSARWGSWTKGVAVAAAAGMVGVGLTIGLFKLLRESKVAVASKPSAASPANPADASRAAPRDGQGVVSTQPVPGFESHPLVPSDLPPEQTSEPLLASDRKSISDHQLANNTTSNPSTAPTASGAAAAPAEPSLPSRVAAPAEQIVSFVNTQLRSAWSAAKVTPSSAATDDEWCSRVFLRTLGRGPTAAELKQFHSEDEATRRPALLERVLGPSYHNLFARHWAKQLTTHLLGSSAARPGSLANRDELEKYLSVSLRRNKSLANITTELLTATGSSQPGPGYNPAVNFLLDGWEPTGLVATSRVARAFLGKRIDCAQCHQHPSSDLTQAHFWAFNAFFRQLRGEKTEEVSRLSNVDFLGEGRGSRDGEVYYETADGLVKSAYPQFLDGTAIPPSGRVASVDRRRELARLVVSSEHLPRAVVNFVWAQYFDFGLISSLDELERPNSPSNLALLERLSSEFAASGMDLKSLIHWTVMCDPFSRSSKLTDLATKDMPEAGESALFSRFYSRPQMGADVFTSLAQAQKIRRSGGTAAERDQARVDWLAQFNRTTTKTGQKASATTNAILSEASTIRSTAGQQAGGIVPRMAVHSMKFDLKVDHLFLAALGRRPTAREARAAATTLSIADNNDQLALEDLWWSLLNSDECILDR